MNKRILIDLDGVLADFVNGICKLHDKANPYALMSNHGNYGLEHLIGMTDEEMWKPVDQYFWEDLEVMKRGYSLLCDLNHCQDVGICTSPGRTGAPAAVAGKRAWIKKHLGEHFLDRTIFVKDKEWVAGPGAILIDDTNHQVDNFIYRGGSAVLFPQPWNRYHNMPEGDIDGWLRLQLGNLGVKGL